MKFFCEMFSSSANARRKSRKGLRTLVPATPILGGWRNATPATALLRQLTFYRLPRAHHKHLKSTNMLERLNEEIKRRTHVVRIFPNTKSCLRLIRALCVETHESWLEDARYLNMTLLAEQKKELLRLAA